MGFDHARPGRARVEVKPLYALEYACLQLKMLRREGSVRSARWPMSTTSVAVRAVGVACAACATVPRPAQIASPTCW